MLYWVSKMKQILWFDWLPGPSCPLGISCFGSTRKTFSFGHNYNKSFIKMAWYWPRYFFAFSLTTTWSRSINTQHYLANTQPSWPSTWLVTDIFHLKDRLNKIAWVFERVTFATIPFRAHFLFPLLVNHCLANSVSFKPRNKILNGTKGMVAEN